MKQRIDLGCGPYKQEGWHGVDVRPLPAVDEVLDLEQGILPYPDESVEEYRASHVLEHIRNLIPLMNEVWRTLKPDGTFTIEVPLFPDVGAIKDPTHVRFFVPESFDYFDTAWNYSGQPDYGIRKYRVVYNCIAGDIPYRAVRVLLQKP
jgi:SAM-dependent methyltransferase